MSSFSIRKLPKELEKALVREAKRKRTTKTEIVIKALQDKFSLSPREKKREKIRHFFGRMSKAQYKSFKAATEGFSQIDEEMWR